MKTVITTESGTEYVFEGRTVRRVTEGGGFAMRNDNEELIYKFWGQPEVGRRMVMVLPPLADGFDSTIRTTTPVVSIREIGE